MTTINYISHVFTSLTHLFLYVDVEYKEVLMFYIHKGQHNQHIMM
jgi:hypothetical protein